MRSKTVAVWLALLGGTLGLHRLYLKGLSNLPAWLHLLPTGLGLIGLERFRTLGQDDRLAWLLMPLLGLMIAQAMLHAIVYGLTADEKWAARHGQPVQDSGWGAVLGVIAALLIGATALMSSIAFGVQKFFEWELAPASAAAAQSDSRSTT
ncbi:MAG: hypothetical protein H6933_10125 [Burkholderiaceae bacterium]|nr:hypothetical protein [Rhodoferax sp.]MCP5285247.1 hypothetical protein [Burkholderiaceae bacterium]